MCGQVNWALRLLSHTSTFEKFWKVDMKSCISLFLMLYAHLFQSKIHILYCAMTAAFTMELDNISDFHLEKYFVVSNRTTVICSMPSQ